MKRYETDLSDNQWQILRKYLETKRKRKYNLREVLNAIFYVNKTGCQWAFLPKDFPPYWVCFYYFNTWKRNGLIDKIQAALVRQARKNQGKNMQPTAAIIDSQSTKSTFVKSESNGIDGNKHVKGVKKHISTDTNGFILTVVISPANIHDSKGAKNVITELAHKYKKVRKIFADQAYGGSLVQWAKNEYGIAIEIIPRIKKKIFEVLRKRWIVERTFAWMDTNRRNSKYYERLDSTGVAMIQMSSIRMMLNGICK
jgi:putative transposase